jgi:outer membrane protein
MVNGDLTLTLTLYGTWPRKLAHVTDGAGHEDRLASHTTFMNQRLPVRSYNFSLLALLAISAVANAQEGAPAHSSDWSGYVGLGVLTLPRYVGGDQYRTVPLPVLQIEYKGRVYIGGSQTGVGGGAGVYLVKASNLTWQAELSTTEPRSEHGGNALAGMGTQTSAMFAATSITSTLGFVSANLGVAHGLKDNSGSYGTLSLTTEQWLGHRWVRYLTVGATAANSANMTHDFGITPEQAAVRHALLVSGDQRLTVGNDDAYRPRGGLKAVNSALSVIYVISKRNRLLMYGNCGRLSTEASRSSLVARRYNFASGVALAFAL